MGRRQLPVLRYPEDPEEKPPELRGRRLLAILIRLRGETGAVPSPILGRHGFRLVEFTARRAVVPPVSLDPRF